MLLFGDVKITPHYNNLFMVKRHKVKRIIIFIIKRSKYVSFVWTTIEKHVAQ